MQTIIDREESKRRVEIIIRECDGIQPTHEAFYIQSIIYAASASNDAFERFARTVVRDSEAAITVSAIQEALTHAAALSRFFWTPSKSKLAQARAAKLRQFFQMEKSPLEDRNLRNALEHFDERLDDFLLTDPVGWMYPGPLVQPHDFEEDAPGRAFRLVDPWEFVFVVLGKKYPFLAVRFEVRRILEDARSFDSSGGRLKGA